MQRSRSMREVLEALEWVRREMMYHGSPDFIRQRELEGRVRQLAARLARRESGAAAASTPACDNAPPPTKNQATR